jgi:hypothetical protein
MAELRQRLGEFLGLPGPAPEEVVRRALDDPSFETDLITARGVPGFLRALFDQPATRGYAVLDAGPTVPDPAAPSPAMPSPAGSAALIARAVGAVLRWGKAGFATVPIEDLRRREDACLACPHLSEPRAAVQKLVPAGPAGDRTGARTGRKVCGLCGCVVARKIRLVTESCPAEHPRRAGLSRWGEPAAGQAGG